jgi:hypothetical protein
MRARSLKPGMYKNEQLADCSYAARHLFPGLWCMADREGRLEDRPKRIQAELFPYDHEADIEALLQELESKREPDGTPAFILRYQVGSGRYIQVVHFTRHQCPHMREPQSRIPAPGQHCAGPVPVSGEHRAGPSDSGLLTPDSGLLTPHSNGRKASTRGSKARQPLPDDAAHSFAAFWAVYPKRVAKAEAERAWATMTSADRTAALAAAPGWVARWWESQPTRKTSRLEYMPHAATWLRNRRWTDEHPTELSGPGAHETEDDDVILVRVAAGGV